MAEPLKVVLDRRTCVGHGRCYALAPEVFDEDDEGYCIILLTDVPEAERHNARMAIDNCPEEALRIED